MLRSERAVSVASTVLLTCDVSSKGVASANTVLQIRYELYIGLTTEACRGPSNEYGFLPLKPLTVGLTNLGEL
jgi:hypothetical protein